MRPTAALLLLLAVACSGPEVPAEPTWVDDVRPILAANCIRCHSPPYIGGVPQYFRLDMYEDDLVDDPVFEEPIWGAAKVGDATVVGNTAFQDVLVTRVTMPPRFPLTDRQTDVLIAWSEAGAPKGEPRAGNSPPTMTVVGDIEVNPGRVGLSYAIEDADGDIVTGVILSDPGGGADPEVETNELFAGRDRVNLALETGTYELFAEIDDGSERVTVELGTVVVP